jgi:hypothetical protein
MNYLEEIDEDNQIELINLNKDYQLKLRIILNQIQQLENEEILLKLRVCLFNNSFLEFLF